MGRWLIYKYFKIILTTLSLNKKIILLLYLSTASALVTAELPPSTQKLLNQYKVPKETLSVFVQQVDAEEPLLLLNPDTPRNPASVIKLVTTYAGLELLGPAYTWKTDVYADGDVVDGKLNGNLVLKGYGDPYLIVERFWKLLQEVQLKGITHIMGDLIVDDTYFSLPEIDRGAFDGRPYHAYNAAPNALLLNFQVTRFTMMPDVANGEVDIVTDPPSASLLIDNRMRLEKSPCSSRHTAPNITIVNSETVSAVKLEGSYARSCGEQVFFRVVNPHALHVYGTFISFWKTRGGTFAGRLKLAATPPGAKLVFSQPSLPLADQIRTMNKYSNNVMTRQLLLTIGAEKLGPPGTLEKGQQAIKQWAMQRGFGSEDLAIDNGSGLSRISRISARSLAVLLLDAWKNPLMPEFISSLAITGIDGTARRRFKNHGLHGRIHVKTGTINNVRCAAGYLQTQSGKRYVFVIMQNHANIDKQIGTRIQDSLLLWLDNHG